MPYTYFNETGFSAENTFNSLVSSILCLFIAVKGMRLATQLHQVPFLRNEALIPIPLHASVAWK